MDPNRNRTNSNQNQQLPPPKVDGYKLNHLIGKGSYGHVYRSEKLGSHEVVAIKCVPLKTLGKSSRENLITEISILKKLKHPFIVQMLDFQWDKAFIYIILEFCSGGELASVIRLKRSFSEEIVQHFLQQLASAMKYLRDNNVAHLDLKPQNILITGIQFVSLLNGLNSFKVWRYVILKIADFGFAQYLSNDERVNSLRGSPLYMAPEILKRREYDARADLWSIGIILFECLFGLPPLHGMTTAEITKAFLTGQVKIEIPKNKLTQLCYDLLKGLLKIDPDKRISFNNFFSHPFIDLEHMPTKESYSKAMDIIKVASENETIGNLKTAFYNFREALLYLVPLYRWGVPENPLTKSKQEQLKSVILRNMEKAENLQQKCGLVNIEPTLLKRVQSIYNLIDRARDLASKDLYKQSWEKYELALEQSFEIIECSDPKIRLEFFSEMNDWITEAEMVKRNCLEENNCPKQNAKKQEAVLAQDAADDNQEATTTNSNNQDWYLKQKEPSKSNQSAHSKLKCIDCNNVTEHLHDTTNDDTEVEEAQEVKEYDEENIQNNEPICSVQ